MKTKILIILSLAATMWLVGCRGDANANVKANNGNTAMMTTPTPVMKTNETATDPMMKGKVEKALKDKGFNDVTVDSTTTPMTLRGTVGKNKMTEAVQVAQEAAGKPVKSELTEK